MKKYILSLISAVFALAVSAQTPEVIREIIRQNPNFAEPTVTTYDNIKIGKIAEPPKGCKPFYFTMTSRHGSRYELYDEYFSQPTEVYNRASELGILTPLGEEVRAILNRATAEQTGRGGELTSLGQAQLRGVGRRAYANFKSLFDSGSVEGKASTKMRCVFSMVAFVDGLKEKNSTMPVEIESREGFLPMLRPMADHTDIPRELKRDWAKYAKKGEGWTNESLEWLSKQDISQMLSKITTNPELIVEKCGGQNIYLFACNTHHLLLFSQNLGVCDGNIMTRVFTPEEQYAFYIYQTNRWLHFSGGWGNPFIELYTSYMKPLVDDILGKAQEAIDGKNPHIANLRFTHDTYVVPLLSIFGYEGCALQYGNDLELACCSAPLAKLMPMAANIQLVLYRNKVGDVLVRSLINEGDAYLPIECRTAPFYPWEEFCKLVDKNMARLIATREKMLPSLYNK